MLRAYQCGLSKGRKMTDLTITPIGTVVKDESVARLEIDDRYRTHLTGLEKYSHINVIWWFSECDDDESRKTAMVHPKHDMALPLQGIFATRSPMRPNPLALSCARIKSINMDRCVIVLEEIDAFDGSPVVDIKPYIPRLDTADGVVCPDWGGREKL